MLLLCVVAGLLQSRAVADAPPGRYTIGTDGTVVDTRAKLTWQRTVDAGTYAWAVATTYCGNSSLAGGGWRMPTIQELLTLVDPTKFNPAIDGKAFPSTPAEPFWSSTPKAGGNVWYVDMVSGASNNTATNKHYSVRCVR